MDNWDKIIRQKVSGLDTPPPGTGWQPARGWEKLQGQLKPAKPVRPAQRWTWYHAAAAAFAVLLVPFTVMLLDIRRQQARIDHLSAQLARAKPAVTQPLPAPPAARIATSVPPPLTRLTAPTTAAREIQNASLPAMPVPDAAQEGHHPKGDGVPDSEATRLASVPAPAVPHSGVEAANTPLPAPAGHAPGELLRLVSTSPKREASSITIVFEGNGPDTVGVTVLASTTDPTPAVPRRRLLRAFGATKREESLYAQPPAPHNILSLLNKQR